MRCVACQSENEAGRKFCGECGTLLAHAEWLAGEGRAAEAEPLLSEAWEIFERLGATPWLERTFAALQEQIPA